MAPPWSLVTIVPMSMSNPERPWAPLSARERRVLGVLIEKQKTTPEYYPMTVNALVTGCNQKSARDPVTNYDADDVEETLQELRHKGVAIMVEGGGRAVKWKHSAYEWLGLKGRAAEMAVLAELLLRGPQTEGELRQRAGRMDPIADLPALQTLLAGLQELGLVVQLTPGGQRRGVVVTHTLYPPKELDALRQSALQGHHAAEAAEAAEPAAPRSGGGDRGAGWAAEAQALRAEVQALREQVEALAAELNALKQSLGA